MPIVVAAATWGKSWAGGSVLAKCDNAAIVAMINNGNCKEQECMHLLWCLSFIGAEFDFNLVATHVEGRENVLADVLSRNNISPVNSMRRLMLPQPSSRRNWWTFLSCSSPTGHQQLGQSYEALFSPRSSRILSSFL